MVMIYDIKIFYMDGKKWWLKHVTKLYKLGLYQVTNSVYNVCVHTDHLQFNQFTVCNMLKYTTIYLELYRNIYSYCEYEES